MAIIICPECKKEISDKSKVCIHCGFPLQNSEQNNAPEMNDAYSLDNGLNAPSADSGDVNNYPQKENMFNGNAAPYQNGGYGAPYNNMPYNDGSNNGAQNNIIPPFGNAPYNDGSYNNPQYNYQNEAHKPPKKKKKTGLVVVLIILVVCLLAGGGCAYYFLFMNTGLEVKNINTASWTKNYSKEYSMKLTSEQKKPFAALMKVTDGDTTYDKYVFMDNGEGEITELRSSVNENDSLPTETVAPMGYYEGEVTKDGFLKDIFTEYYTGNYLDELKIKKYSLDDTYKKASFNLTTHHNETGILIYDVSTNLNKSVDKNKVMAIVDGKGRSEIIYYVGSANRDKDFEATFIPKFFIKAENTSEADYDVITKLSLEKNDYDEGYVNFSGREKVSLKDKNTGMFLYQVNRTSGSPVIRSRWLDDDYSEWYGFVQTEGKVANIGVNQTFRSGSIEPSYSISIKGYIDYKPIGNGVQPAEGGSGGSSNDKPNGIMPEQSNGIDKKNYFKNIKTKIGALDHYTTIASDGSYMEIDTNPSDLDDYSSEDAYQYILDANKEMGFPESLNKTMSKTRSIDGAQTDENDIVKVRWTYHPDKGLEVIYTLK